MGWILQGRKTQGKDSGKEESLGRHSTLVISAFHLWPIPLPWHVDWIGCPRLYPFALSGRKRLEVRAASDESQEQRIRKKNDHQSGFIATASTFTFSNLDQHHHTQRRERHQKKRNDGAIFSTLVGHRFHEEPRKNVHFVGVFTSSTT